MFLSLIQGLGFQFAIARLPIRIQHEAERTRLLYLPAVSTPSEHAACPRHARSSKEATEDRRGSIAVGSPAA